MTSQAVKIGICGLGTVGSGTFNVLGRNAEAIAARAQSSIEVVHVGARRDNPDCDLGATRVSRDVFEVARDPDVQILVELIGGTTVAKDLVEEALRNGKHVVTANKALIAEFGNELFALAKDHQAVICYEAAVAGGIPIIKALREGLAGNRIEWLAGIINGTGNFILSEMRDKGRDFADVLAEAQALGYAEADPTFDVEGIDAAHKLVILASLAFGMPLRFSSVYTEGITRLTPQDVEYAEELGYRIKHLGVAKQSKAGIELRVHPTLIPEARLLANVNGVKNAVLVEGDAVGPTLYYGAGAGAEPTASAVVADIVDLARELSAGQSFRVPSLGFADECLNDLPVVPMAEVVTPWYLRMVAEDKPGVLSAIATIFSNEGISIEALIQKAPAEGETRVPLIVLTNRAMQGSVDKAVSAIEALDSISGEVARIRVEVLDG
ncbi:homoserine dehydrogenase [Pseudohalioglobus lutimaris]|uniref:Homoserine dehydrogenase n=1 Tax=Pseudohalioglobus lutimaris TaxID=1737061 RepID=A0A2N5X0R1_9GAMM|nr:homoserine dehydrogenase [Pseudohalioglobus lutimaris]PLW68082.1 homoserine dehydrogenase [Pseudohalioglobus lutimaris]